ncbi:MAG: hypothetical protein ACJ749_20290 [Flavisolibacter sp.]
MRKKLKIGFIITDAGIPAWYFETIHKFLTRIEDDIYFIKIPISNSKTKKPLFYKLFERFEDRWFNSEFDALKLFASDSLLNLSNAFAVKASTGLWLDQHDLASLRAYEFDIIYTIDFDETSSENLSSVSVYGLWYIRFGIGKYQNKLPVAFWEVMQNCAITGSSLLTRKNDKTFILYEGTTRTVPYSVKNNFNSIAWKTASYLELKSEALSLSDEYFFSRYAQTQPPQFSNTSLPGVTMPFLFIKNSFRYLVQKLQQKFNRKRFTLHYANTKFTLEHFTKTRFSSIPLPPAVFYADPFVIEKEGVIYIFFEEFQSSKNKAQISMIKIVNNEVSKVTPVLERPYHLSYPFVFFYEGFYYMIPETSSNKTVELYRAANFPNGWEFVMNLVEGKEMIDATLHFSNGKWWLFANSASHPFVSTNDQLFLYYSPDLFSNKWIPHPQNPIATHIDNCRPAGRVFKYLDKYYRPAQNNASQQYGYGLKFNEIISLNETEYEEKEILSITPELLGLKACHHIDFAENFIVIDGFE